MRLLRLPLAGIMPLMSKLENLALGLAGEEKAARYLAGGGWRLLARNWRPHGLDRGLELDIVAIHDNCLVFVEVKTRRLPGHPQGAIRAGAGEEKGSATAGRKAFIPLSVPVHAALTPAKQKKLARAALRYLSAHDLWNRPCRFDLICIELHPDGQDILEHHRNVIEFRQVVDSGNTAWQPW
jgi:putative endonuclease